MMNHICPKHPFSLGVVCVEALCPLSTSPLAASGRCGHCLEVNKAGAGLLLDAVLGDELLFLGTPFSVQGGFVG